MDSSSLRAMAIVFSFPLQAAVLETSLIPVELTVTTGRVHFTPTSQVTHGCLAPIRKAIIRRIVTAS